MKDLWATHGIEAGKRNFHQDNLATELRMRLGDLGKQREKSRLQVTLLGLLTVMTCGLAGSTYWN